MRLMLINMDRTIFNENSQAGIRLSRLGDKVENIDSITFSARHHNIGNLREMCGNIRLYPTNSFNRFFYIIDAILLIRKIKKPDIISAQDPFETGLVGYVASVFYKAPFMVDIHTDFFTKSYIQHSFLNKIRVLIARFILKRAKGICVVSEGIKNKINKNIPNLIAKPVVAPIYVDVIKYSNIKHIKHPKFKKTILWVGRMESEKNPHLALDVFLEIIKKGYDAGLIFVGSGRLFNGLKEMVKSYGLEDRVDFIGHVLDVSEYYAYADLLLVTSKYEGYGMVIVEALAAGIPVVSTNVGIAEEAGAIIVENDFETIVAECLNHPPVVRFKLKTYANEDEYLDKIVSHYEAVLSK